MADDPIERIGAEIEIYGMPVADGAPPMTVGYFHVRRRQDGAAGRAVMGLPAYEGKQGPTGPPGAIHQGERDTAELTSLATILDEANTNWAYRNTDTNDQYVWSGEAWVIYHGVYATPGPVGPAPTLTPGSLTIDGEPYSGPYGVRIAGSAGSYSVGIDLPEMPQGEEGPPGPSGPIFTSVDVDQTSVRDNGDTLVYNATSGKLQWLPVSGAIEEYVVPPASFPNASLTSTTSRRDLVTIVIPAKTYPYRFDFTGGVDVDSRSGHQIDLEIRTTDPVTGPLVGMGKGQDGEGWREVAFRAHSDVAIDPTTSVGVIAPGTAVTLYVSAVKRAGIIFGWGVRNDRAQLRVRLMRTA